MDNVIPLSCTLKKPLMISRSFGATNQRYSIYYIRGSTIWGAFADSYRKKTAKNVSQDDIFYNFFLSGKVRFGNLYLNNTIPVPLSVYVCSGDQNHFRQDCLVNPPQKWRCSNEECGLPLKNLNGYCSYDALADNLGKQEPTFEFRMRNRVSSKKFTTSEEGLFSDALLSQEQRDSNSRSGYFGGFIAFQEENLYKKFQSTFQEEMEGKKNLHLGKCRHIYGEVACSVQNGQNEIVEYLPFQERWHKAEIFSITLLSDTIVSDPWLRFSNRLEPKFLKKWMGLQGELELKNWFSQIAPVYSFSGVHLLPREEDIALSKGSCFFYHYKPQKDENDKEISEKFLKLERHGLGFRLAEGFGQVIINLPIHGVKHVTQGNQ